MGLFDRFRQAAGDATEAAQEAAESVAGTVGDAAQDAVDLVSPPPTTFTIEAPLGEGSPAVVVGPPDTLMGDVERAAGPSATVRFGDAELTVDTWTVMPGTPTAHGGVGVGGFGVGVDIDAPGVDGSATAEQEMTTNPMVIGWVPEVGGPAVGGGVDVTLSPDELTAPPAPDLPDEFDAPPAPDLPDVVVDVAMVPSPGGPVPMPYPNVEPLDLQPASSVPVEPERLLPPEEYVEPAPPADDLDVESTVPEPVEFGHDVQPEVPEPEPPQFDFDPQHAADHPLPPDPSEFDRDLQAIDDTADDFDIFD